MHLQFVESESTFAYFHATRAYLEAWGKPVAFYSDKHGVFRVNHEGALGGDGMTQFGRALDALNIDIICANSSQAKGRVERAHKTLQDRLVKELRLAGASSLAAGNALLPAFMADYNARFAKPPANGKDLHRPLRAERRSGGCLCLEGRAHALAGTDPPIRQGDLRSRAERPGQGGDRQAGHRGRLSRWPAVDPLQRCRAGLPHLRQAAAGLAGRDCREQAARRRSCRSSASSRLHGPSPAARRHRADAISAMRDCSKSAELLYEPSELTLAR